MCVKVYRTYPYYIILLGSIAVVYFIGAIILAHTHIYAFICLVKTNINGRVHNASGRVRALQFLCMCCFKP